MKIILTRRVNGNIRIGVYQVEHWATGLHYGEDEIEQIRVLEIPEAYETMTGRAYKDEKYGACDIWDHPLVKKQIKAWK